MDNKELAESIARQCIENGCDETSFPALSSRIRQRIREMRAELEAARLGETIGDRIKHMRMAQGLTLRGLGEMIGVGGAAVHQWETGGSKDMKNETLLRLAQALNVDPGLLVWGPAGQPALKRVRDSRKP